MVFYHVSADIQGPLMDAPWFRVTGCTKPTGQVTGWKLSILQQDVMGINAFPLLCSEPVTALYELQCLTDSVGLIMGDQPKLSVVKTCNYS